MLKYFVSLIIVCVGYSTISFAYDNKKTHPSLTEKAVEHAEESNTFLKEQLGFTRGYTQFLSNGIKNRKITDWLQDGSKEEDEPACRAANHFHDPLKPWEESQLTDNVWYLDTFFCKPFYPGFRTKYSNISWATGIKNKDDELMSANINGTSVAATNGRNWFVARDYYYQPLTATTPQLREHYFAETFHTLGYVLHLLEDMAVPAHTRNDFSSSFPGYSLRNMRGCSVF